MNTGKHMTAGIIFLIIGIALLLKAVFHVDIPIFKTVFGIFLIYLGAKMIFGNFWCGRTCDIKTKTSAFFDEKVFKASQDVSNKKQYSTVFGSSTVDLTDLDILKEEDIRVEVNTVFGETKVLLSQKIPVKIFANSVFAEAKMPNNNLVAFGTLVFESPDNSGKKITIHGNVVFGSLRFVYQ